MLSKLLLILLNLREIVNGYAHSSVTVCRLVKESDRPVSVRHDVANPVPQPFYQLALPVIHTATPVYVRFGIRASDVVHLSVL